MSIPHKKRPRKQTAKKPATEEQRRLMARAWRRFAEIMDPDRVNGAKPFQRKDR